MEMREAIKTLIVDFYPPHLREAIIKLRQENIIDIKYWLIDGEGKYAGEPHMHIANLNQMEQEYLREARVNFSDGFYEKAHHYLYLFMNIDNRWNPSTELCTYVHNFNRLLRIWHHVMKLNKIELMIMGNAPHAPIQFMAYVVAKSLGIKIILTEQNWFIKDRFMCFRSLDLIGCDYLDKNLGFEERVSEKMGGFQKTPFFMAYMPDELLDSGRFRILPTARRWLHPKIFLSKIKELNSMFLYKILEKLGYRTIDLYLDRCFRKHRNDQCKFFDREKKYVYFPLHLQPEMTTDTLGGIYEDQPLAIERLDQILPEGWCIYIKENPIQTYYKRNIEFFKRLNLIPKETLVHPQTDTFDLIEHADFVATITGSAGWEAITAGKKCLCFGYAWYRSLAGVIRYTPGMTFEDISRYHFTKEDFDRSYERFCKSLFPGIVAGDFFSNLKEDFSPDTNNAEVYYSLKMAIEHYDR